MSANIVLDNGARAANMPIILLFSCPSASSYHPNTVFDAKAFSRSIGPTSVFIFAQDSMDSLAPAPTAATGALHPSRWASNHAW
jgi:hypothetical protein